MSAYDLPTSVEIGGRTYKIRSDFRAILDVIAVMADTATDDEERALVVLSIFYEDFSTMPLADFQAALDYVQWFVNGGNEPTRPHASRLMDWEQDFQLIAAPVNRVLGYEVRSADYLHWWTFLAAYREIGDCLFAQVVSIRKKKRAGKKLDKADEQFYRENRDLVDFKRKPVVLDNDGLDEWIKGGC